MFKTPQLFHEISAEVGVAPNSDRARQHDGANPRFAERFLNMRAGNTIAHILIRRHTFVVNTAPTSEATMRPLDFTALRTGRSAAPERPPSRPPRRTPSAVMTSQIVSSMLAMPPAQPADQSAIAGRRPIAARQREPHTFDERKPRAAAARRAAKATTRSGATNTASTPPASAPMKIAVKGGKLQQRKTQPPTEAEQEPGRNMECVPRSRPSLSLASNSPGLPIPRTPPARSRAPSRDQRGLAEVLIKIDAAYSGCEVGRIRQAATWCRRNRRPR